jgi:hypothetical protein
MVEHSGTFVECGVTGLHLGLFRTKRGVEHCGTLWNILERGVGFVLRPAKRGRSRRRGERREEDE